MKLNFVTVFLLILNAAVIFGAIAKATQFFVAWYFAFHFVKKFKHLPAHMRPPGWPPTNR